MKRTFAQRRARFVREVGSVVLGVLIALGIGEIADALRWQVRVRSSLDAMQIEMAGNRFNLVERRTYQDCLERRLSEIDRILKDARRSGSLPDIKNLGRPGMRHSESAAFEVAKSEGVPLHMDRAKARDWASAYEGYRTYEQLTGEEQQSWRTLRLLEDNPGPISSDLLTALMVAWANASAQANWIRIVSQQQDGRLRDLGVNIEFDSSMPNVRSIVEKSRDRPICKPMLVVIG